MKNHLIILLLILTSCNSDKIDEAEFSAFSDIEIRFRTGDERIEFYSMNILKKGEEIQAIKKSPFYYYGSGTDSTWTTKIGKSDLKFITEFLKRSLINYMPKMTWSQHLLSSRVVTQSCHLQNILYKKVFKYFNIYKYCSLVTNLVF